MFRLMRGVFYDTFGFYARGANAVIKERKCGSVECKWLTVS